MASDDPKFTCPTCGKHYRWKPEMAGRSAKCSCGGKLVVPAEPPTSNAASFPAAAVPPTLRPSSSASPAAPRIAEAAAACPSCKIGLPANAVLCVNCGYNLKTGKTLGEVVVETSNDSDDDDAEPLAKRSKSPV